MSGQEGFSRGENVNSFISLDGKALAAGLDIRRNTEEEGVDCIGLDGSVKGEREAAFLLYTLYRKYRNACE